VQGHNATRDEHARILALSLPQTPTQNLTRFNQKSGGGERA
jgi:hypothetical protein